MTGGRVEPSVHELERPVAQVALNLGVAGTRSRMTASFVASERWRLAANPGPNDPPRWNATRAWCARATATTLSAAVIPPQYVTSGWTMSTAPAASRLSNSLSPDRLSPPAIDTRATSRSFT